MDPKHFDNEGSLEEDLFDDDDILIVLNSTTPKKPLSPSKSIRSRPVTAPTSPKNLTREHSKTQLTSQATIVKQASKASMGEEKPKSIPSSPKFNSRRPSLNPIQKSGSQLITGASLGNQSPLEDETKSKTGTVTIQKGIQGVELDSNASKDFTVNESPKILSRNHSKSLSRQGSQSMSRRASTTIAEEGISLPKSLSRKSSFKQENNLKAFESSLTKEDSTKHDSTGEALHLLNDRPFTTESNSSDFNYSEHGNHSATTQQPLAWSGNSLGQTMPVDTTSEVPKDTMNGAHSESQGEANGEGLEESTRPDTSASLVLSVEQKPLKGILKKSTNFGNEEPYEEEHATLEDQSILEDFEEPYIEAEDDDDESLIIMNNVPSKILHSQSQTRRVEHEYEDFQNHFTNQDYQEDEEGEEEGEFYRFLRNQKPSTANRHLVSRCDQKFDVGHGWDFSTRINRHDQWKVDSIFRGVEISPRDSRRSTPVRTATASSVVFKKRVQSKLPTLISRKTTLKSAKYDQRSVTSRPITRGQFREKFSTRNFSPENSTSQSEDEKAIVENQGTKLNKHKLSGIPRAKNEKQPLQNQFKPVGQTGKKTPAVIPKKSPVEVPSSPPRESPKLTKRQIPKNSYFARKNYSMIPVLKKSNNLPHYLTSTKRNSAPLVKIIPQNELLKTNTHKALKQDQKIVMQQAIKRPLMALPPVETIVQTESRSPKSPMSTRRQHSPVPGLNPGPPVLSGFAQTQPHYPSSPAIQTRKSPYQSMSPQYPISPFSPVSLPSSNSNSRTAKHDQNNYMSGYNPMSSMYPPFPNTYQMQSPNSYQMHSPSSYHMHSPNPYQMQSQMLANYFPYMLPPFMMYPQQQHEHQPIMDNQGQKPGYPVGQHNMPFVPNPFYYGWPAQGSPLPSAAEFTHENNQN